MEGYIIKDYKSMKDFIIDIKKKLTYEDQRKEVQYSVVFQILFFVSIMMTLLNAYMHKGNLTFATFFFWTPIGRQFLMYEYTDSFRQRFPLLFVAFFMMTLFLETVRVLTQNELDIARERNDYLSMHDELTGAYNRHGLKELILKKKWGRDRRLSCLISIFLRKLMIIMVMMLVI